MRKEISLPAHNVTKFIRRDYDGGFMFNSTLIHIPAWSVWKMHIMFSRGRCLNTVHMAIRRMNGKTVIFSGLFLQILSP